MQKKLLPIVMGLAIFTLFNLSSYFQSKSVHFFGIVDDREQTISFQYPVEIVQIFTVEGEKVHQGMDILEVKRENLTSKIGIINEEVRMLESKHAESNQSILSQIKSLKAERQVASANIDLKIHQIELRMKRNRTLLEGISGADAGSSARNDPGFVEINDLERKHRFMIKSINAKVNHLTFQLNSGDRPVDSRIAGLQEKKFELQRQGGDLKVAAKLTGRISSIHYKSGELVPPFKPIMSVHSLVPRYIKGYIHENILNDVKIGQKVWVKRTAHSRKKGFVNGIVESLGNRIVEYPLRLNKNPAVPSWGREVVVRLGKGHALLFGEKVDVLTELPTSLVQSLRISFTDSAGAKVPLDDDKKGVIRSNDPAIKGNTIEASGILWDGEKGQYILVSDEEVDKQPGVFTMNEKGSLTSRLSFLEDTRIDDLESISRDGENIYISASLSHNRRDRLKTKRRKLIRFTYNDQGVSIQDEVDLYNILTQLAQGNSSSEITRFLRAGIHDHSIDIESQVVKGNDLYLGFKTPLDRQGNTVILKLSDIDKIFSGEKVAAAIWQTIQLLDPETGEPSHLSDMLMREDSLLLTSVTRSSLGTRSYLWRYFHQDKKLEKLKQFPGLKAEGIANTGDGKSMMVVFDQGGGMPSEYQLVAVSFE